MTENNDAQEARTEINRQLNGAKGMVEDLANLIRWSPSVFVLDCALDYLGRFTPRDYNEEECIREYVDDLHEKTDRLRRLGKLEARP